MKIIGGLLCIIGYFVSDVTMALIEMERIKRVNGLDYMHFISLIWYLSLVGFMLGLVLLTFS